MNAVVIHVIKTTPRVRCVDDMNKMELAIALDASVGAEKFRELLPEVLNRRIIAMAADTTAPDVVCTIGFPAARKKRKSYSTIEFDMIIKSLVHKLYHNSSHKSLKQRTMVLRNKTRLAVNDMDLVDNILLAVARQALHDGRSEARKQFFQHCAFCLIVKEASMELLDPVAVAAILGT